VQHTKNGFSKGFQFLHLGHTCSSPATTEFPAPGKDNIITPDISPANNASPQPAQKKRRGFFWWGRKSAKGVPPEVSQEALPTPQSAVQPPSLASRLSQSQPHQTQANNLSKTRPQHLNQSERR
ncbi:uncharacterized protein METZ01_LOCUS354759, partial [marine metagenome]